MWEKQFGDILAHFAGKGKWKEEKRTTRAGDSFLEQGTGIEPASVAWEATILPMN